jgi:hypothetical protein
MNQQILSMPPEGTPEFAELCRRQDAICRGVVGDRPALLAEGVGRWYVPDPPTPVARPRFTTEGVAIVEPSISVTSPPRPAKRLPWYRRLF